jgi:hypothetical protein
MSVVTYHANHDTYIDQADTTANDGTGDYVLVSGYSGNVKKGLVSWDLSAASISKLVGGKLRLYVNYNAVGTITVTVYRLLKAFGENTATWIKASASVNWGVNGMGAGTDYSATAMATSTWTSERAWYDLDITNLGELKSMVADNYGIVVIVTSGTDSGMHGFEAVDKYGSANEAQLILTYAGGGDPAYLSTFGVL